MFYGLFLKPAPCHSFVYSFAYWLFVSSSNDRNISKMFLIRFEAFKLRLTYLPWRRRWGNGYPLTRWRLTWSISPASRPDP